MRWDRLFEDLEAQVDELERDERDALVEELRDGDWAETSWRDLLGGRVVLEVAGAGVLEGEVALVNERLVQLAGERMDHVVAADAVVAVHATQRRADETGRVSDALGWGHVFRAVRDAGSGRRDQVHRRELARRDDRRRRARLRAPRDDRGSYPGRRVVDDRRRQWSVVTSSAGASASSAESARAYCREM